MTAPFPAALVEAVANGLPEGLTCLRPAPCNPDGCACMYVAQRALSALPAAVQAVARGEAVAVPREPTPEMIEDAAEELPTWAGDMPDDEAVIGIYDALLAASPYAQEPQR